MPSKKQYNMWRQNFFWGREWGNGGSLMYNYTSKIWSLPTPSITSFR